MFRNCYYDKWKSKIHLWETKDGKRTHEEIDYVPYVFIEDRGLKNKVKSIFRKGVTKREFDSFKEYDEFNKKEGTKEYVFENNVSPELQFLAEKYHEIDDDKMEMVPLTTLFFDIEVVSEKIDYSKLVLLKNLVTKEEHLCSANNYKKFFNETDRLAYKNKDKWELFDRNTLNAFKVRGGFPDAEEASWPISLISHWDSAQKKLFSFGLREYNGKFNSEDWFEYRQIKGSELDLIVAYIDFVHDSDPDVITGWNIIRFDLPYIVNRVYKLCVEGDGSARENDMKIGIEEREKIAKKILNKLSPIFQTRIWKKDILTTGKTETKIDIPGVTIIDYCNLYKQYSKTLLRINHESYRLDYIAKYELGKGKLEYKDDYGNLTDLYNDNYDLYVEYNAIDNLRVKEIQEKRKFIDIVQLLSLVAKFPMKYYEAVTTIIEGIFLTYYRRHGLAAEHFYGGFKEPFDAAFVKEPQVGLHGFGCDIDIKSSYPHAMMTLNMGNESYIGIIKNVYNGHELAEAAEKEITSYTTKREYPEFIYQKRNGDHISVLKNENITESSKDCESLEEFNQKLKENKISIAPNGAMFSNEYPSCLATVQKTLFMRRVEYKDSMKKWGKKADEFRRKYKETGDEKYNEDAEKCQLEYERFKALQIVIKLVINSMYGALSVPYFRGYNLSIAQAITAVGRLAIKNGMQFVNFALNNPSNSKSLKETLDEMKKAKEEWKNSSKSG